MYSGWDLVVSLVFIAVALWLLFLDFASRLNRSFALVLCLRGLDLMLLSFYPRSTAQLDASEVAGLLFRLEAYLVLALPVAALWFGLEYRQQFAVAARGGPRDLPWAVPLALWATVLALEGAYLVNHDWWISDAGAGPLFVVDGARPVVYAGLAWLLLGDYLRAGSGATRKGLALVSLGFALQPLYAQTFFFVDNAFALAIDFGGPSSGYAAFTLFGLGGAAIALVVALGARVWIASSRSRFPTRSDARRFTVPLVVAFAAGFAVAVAFRLAARAWAGNRTPAGESLFFFVNNTSLAVNTLFELALPALVGYSLARHRLFDLDLRVRWAISRGAVGAAFVAAFFIVGEGAQVVLSDRFGALGAAGPLLGVVGAGLLLFALHPLQRLGGRLADASVPNAKPIGSMSHHERTTLYREQAELAWLDGTLQRKERMLLDQLRLRLGLDVGESAHIEHQVVAAVQAGPRRRPRVRV